MEPIDLTSFLGLVAQGFNVAPLSETLQLDRETPVSLYQRFGSRAIFLLESAALGEATGRYSFIGLDRRWRVTTHDGATLVEGTDGGDPSLAPLDAIRHILAGYRTHTPRNLPDFFGGAVGFVTYDYVRRLERLPRQAVADMWPDVDFSFPGAVLICDHVQHSTTAVVNAVVDEGEDAEAVFNRASAQLQAIVDVLLGVEPASDPVTERLVATAPSQRARIDVRTIAKGLSNFTGAAYGDVVERAREHVFAGDVFQVVPSQQFQRPSAVNPLTLYRVLRALNPSPYMYLLDSGEIQIVGASPEMLMRVHDGLVSYRPIAGTRARGVNESEDLELEHELLHDEKEIAEHVMLVDLGRNDLGRVSDYGSVKVRDLMYVERYSHVMHLVSALEGRLRPELNAMDAFAACFPAGTLSGAPKVRAMQIIEELEPTRRGVYGGSVLYADFAGNLDSCIAIRTLLMQGKKAYLQAGAGIVADSDPQREFEETENKARAVLRAVEMARGSG